MDSEKAASVYPGALRLITFHVEQVNEVVAGSLPIRWSSTSEERPMLIKKIVQESADVKSFYLQPLPQDKRPLWNFHAGQHLPIRLLTEDGAEVRRTYSLSGAPSGDGYYRISVKRHNLGLASRILHDEMSVGDVLEISRPSGDFFLPEAKTPGSSSEYSNCIDQERLETKSDQLVLLSSGIGITPLLSMLHAATSTEPGTSRNYKRIVWLHGARDGKHHPFQDEVQQVKTASTIVPVETHIRYSQPTEADDAQYDSIGRIDSALILSKLRTEDDVRNAHYYLCGPSSFMSEMEDNLNQLGVDPERIHFESF